MFQIVFTSRSTGLCVRRANMALRTFRLKYAGGNADRISFHPSSFVKFHIITAKLRHTCKSSLTGQFHVHACLEA